MDFYLTNAHSARRNTMYVAIAAGAAVGAFVEVLGGKFAPAFAACVIVTGAVEFVRAVLYVEPNWKEQRKIAASPIRRRLLFSALSAAVLLVISRLRVPQTIAFASERKLLAVSSDPTDPKNIDEAKEVLTRAKVAKIQINPTTLQKTGQKFVKASNQNPAAWDAAIAFVDYKSFSNKGSQGVPESGSSQRLQQGSTIIYATPPPGMIAPVMGWFGGIVPKESAARLEPIGKDINEGSKPGVRFLFASGGALLLDGIEARNVVFANVHITYEGGQVDLTNVYFINCTFEMKLRPNSQSLAAAVLSSAPATTFSGM
jgi:hypothetical protein